MQALLDLLDASKQNENGEICIMIVSRNPNRGYTARDQSWYTIDKNRGGVLDITYPVAEVLGNKHVGTSAMRVTGSGMDMEYAELEALQKKLKEAGHTQYKLTHVSL